MKVSTSEHVKIFGISREKFIEYTKTIICAVIIALLFRSLFFEQFKVPTSSMVPTIMIDDRLIVSKYAYGYSRFSFPISIESFKGRVFFTPPERGDVIVFKAPDEESWCIKKLIGLPCDKINYIKRLIGLPGDKIQIQDGILYINDVSVQRKRIGTSTQIGERGESIIYDVYEEILPNGVLYKIHQRKRNSYSNNGFDEDNTPIYRVPKGHYFFLGDNRNNSADSRYSSGISYVSEDKLMGRADLIIWPGDFSFKKIFSSMDIGRTFGGLSDAVTH